MIHSIESDKIPQLTDNGGLKVDHDGSGNIATLASLREESRERVIGLLVRRHLSIGLDSVLEAVQLPAGISDLDAGLSNVDGDDLALKTEPSKR